MDKTTKSILLKFVTISLFAIGFGAAVGTIVPRQIGCQSNGTPATQPINLVQVEQDFVDGATQALPFVEDVLVTAEAAGAFTPEQWLAIQKAESAAQALLTQMQGNVGQPAFVQLQQDFNAVMASLGQWHQAAATKLQLKAMAPSRRTS